MKFSEIKDKIKNLGNFKTLSEIKKAGLRICRNTKTGDYWLIEEEFLKPVIKTVSEQQTIEARTDYLFFVYPPRKTGNYFADKYIKWGEGRTTKGYQKKQEAGIKLPNVSSFSGRKYWYSFPLNDEQKANLFWWKIVGERFAVFYTKKETLSDQKLYFIRTKNPEIDKLSLLLSLNSTIQRLFVELGGIPQTGAYTVTELTVEDVDKIPIILLPKDQKVPAGAVLQKNILSIFQELGFNKNKPIRSQEPNPLPDRKALDDIVFDALGLTEQERKEVYWAVCELVKNRLEKAKSV